MSSSSFDFMINLKAAEHKLTVINSQLEIDGGFEGVSTLSLIEAKNYISADFLVRQLYYPFRLWNSKVKKIVKPIFLTYTNGIFHLREYTFDQVDHYNSIRLVKQRKYIIREDTINIDLLVSISKKVFVKPEPLIAFPQADSFERIINLCEMLNEKGVLTKNEITANYDFDERQTNYYTDAGRYLNLIEKSKNEEGYIIFELTKIGKSLFLLSLVDRQLEYVKLILSHKVFKLSLELYLKKFEPPSKPEIVSIMKESNLYKIDADTTYYRRASTILSWIVWIIKLSED